jgi:hypothetical protein
MVIARIREHVVTFNWFAVGVDLMVVAFGVFLGTQANNWNQARIERAAAASYRQEIIADLVENERDLAARQRYAEAVRRHGMAALAAIETAQAPRGEQFLVDAYQASQVWARPLIRMAFDEMTGAGLSRSMGDQATRSRLTSYYTQIKQFDITATSTTAYRDRLRRALPNAVQAAIRAKCDDRVTTFTNGAQISVLPEQCDPDLTQPQVDFAIDRLLAADLKEDLTRNIADLDQKIGGYARFLKLARGLRMRLLAVDGATGGTPRS